MPPKKSAAAAKAAAIAAGKRKVGESAVGGPQQRRSSSRHAAPAATAPPAAGGKAGGGNSRKQKAPQRSRASEDDASDAVAAAAATRGGNGNNGGAGPSSSRLAAGATATADATFKPSSRGRKPGRAIPGAPPPPLAPLNVPKVSLKVELSTLGGAFLGRKPLSVVVPADAALWDVRRSIDAHCRQLNGGLAPPQAARMTMRTIDLGGGGEGGAGGGASSSAGAAAAAREGPPLALEPVHNGKETFLASYSIVPCPGGMYTLEMRPTRLSRQEEAKRSKKRSRRSIEGGDDDGGGGFDALAGGAGGAGPRGRGRPRSANSNPSGRPRSASALAAAAARASAPPPIADDGTRVHLDNGARKRIKWSNDETSLLVGGVQRFGDGQWATIRKAHLALFESTGRTDVDLKDKWRNLKRAMRRDQTVPGLAPEHLATLRAAVAEEDERAAAAGQ